MCRLAAYIGSKLLLERLLIEPEHSLVKQSWAPREMREAVLNADGFGFGWYTDDGSPAVFTNTCPIWADQNLSGLGHSLQSRIWLANVRSATPGQAINHSNTQPFIHEQIMYLHNGYIEDFNENIRQAFHQHLKPKIQAGIQGNTDSEYLFAVFRQYMDGNDCEPEIALQNTVNRLEKLLAGGLALFNVIICNGESLFVCRHAVNGGDCPSLYYTAEHPKYKEGILVASECLSEPDTWREIQPHSLLIISPDSGIKIMGL
jgi:glutamine amidotransferase